MLMSDIIYLAHSQISEIHWLDNRPANHALASFWEIPDNKYFTSNRVTDQPMKGRLN